MSRDELEQIWDEAFESISEEKSALLQQLQSVRDDLQKIDEDDTVAMATILMHILMLQQKMDNLKQSAVKEAFLNLSKLRI